MFPASKEYSKVSLPLRIDSYHIWFINIFFESTVLRSEIETCMRLLGVQRVDQLGMQYVRLH